MHKQFLADSFHHRRDQLRKDWFELLRFATVASDPACQAACRDCAAWLCRMLEGMGFVAEVVPTPGQPLVMAERPADLAGAPTVMFYGHYDVQPTDPRELWEQADPFEPVEREGRVYARGASDNKGQLFFSLQSLAALIEAGVELPRLRIVLEGEEECGSHGFGEFLKEHPEKFGCDILFVCDTNMAADGRAAIVAGLRGSIHATLTLEGAGHDLHSGLHGGLAPNAAQGMARLLATLHDERGAIRIDGFLEGLLPPAPQELVLALESPFNEADYAAETGVAACGGESGVAAQLRLGFRPTIEVNGIASGYNGPGHKTIIPARARAKLSARLCPAQDPAACLAALEKHLRQHCPPGLRLTFESESAGFRGFRLPIDAPVVAMAREILDRMDPRGSVLLWEGASLPIVSELQTVAGAEVLLVGFGVEADHIHAPNESYGWWQAEKAYTFAGSLFARLAEKTEPA